MPDLNLNPVDEALNAAKVAEKKKSEAIASLLTELKGLDARESAIQKSLKELGYKPTRKPRAKKAAASVPAPTE